MGEKTEERRYLMIITQKVTMDMLHRSATPRMDAVQDDQNTRAVEFCLLADGIPFPIPADAQVKVHYVRPDGSGRTYKETERQELAYSIVGNCVTVHVNPEVLEQAGSVLLSATVFGSGYVISTFHILIDVQPNIPKSWMMENEIPEGM